MQRRALLTGMMALAVSQVACQSSAAQRLRASILKGSVPPQMVSGLRQGLPDDVQFQSEIQGCQPWICFSNCKPCTGPISKGVGAYGGHGLPIPVSNAPLGSVWETTGSRQRFNRG
jgi:hypothetical protein